MVIMLNMSNRSSKSIIISAVLPCAGYGSGLRPITHYLPKEMFPVCFDNKPMIELVIRELAAAGIKRICILIRPGKEAIKEYLNGGNTFGVDIDYIEDKIVRGPGRAIIQAAPWVGDNPFLVAFPDCLITQNDRLSSNPCTLLLKAAALDQETSIWTLASKNEKRPPGEYLYIKQKSRHSINTLDHNYIVVGDGNNCSYPTILGARWLVTREIIDELEKDSYATEKELFLPRTISRLLKNGTSGKCIALKKGEKIHDLGSWYSYWSFNKIFAGNDKH